MTGEPGVGKTRLIREFSAFIDELPDLIRFRQGRCLPYGDGVGFWAFGEIVKAQAGILDSDDPEEAGAKLAEAVDAVVDDPAQRDWIRSRLAPLIGAGAGSADVPREELFTAWRRFVEALAYEGRLVLIFEDLHWADVPMLEFIEHLIDEGERPFMVVCAARPELYDRYPQWGEGRRNAIRMALPPLTDSETAVLVSSLLERAVLPASTQSVLIERSGGNPLFAEEFIQLLVDRGLIDLESHDRPVAELHDIPVPESLQALIGSRLDQLPHEDKALLQDAAVVGKVFWSGALAALCGCDEPSVHDRLADVLRRELVRPNRTSALEGQTEYTFWHALIRDVAYGQIPRAGRELKHLSVARWLRGAVADRISDFAEELAYHYTEAIDMARASGVTIAPDVQAEAASAFLLAGERAASLDAVRATGYFRGALELMTAEDPQRPRAAARAAEMAEAQGDYEEGEQLYLAAITGYRAIGDTLGLGEALGLLARTHARRGQIARSEQLMSEAIEVLEREPPSRELARIYARKTGELLSSDRNAECLEWAEKTLELSTRLGLQDEYARALQFRGAARCELGDERGLDDLREAIRLGEEYGFGQVLALARANYAFQLWFRDGPAAALEVWRESQRAAETRGFAGAGADGADGPARDAVRPGSLGRGAGDQQGDPGVDPAARGTDRARRVRVDLRVVGAAPPRRDRGTGRGRRRAPGVRHAVRRGVRGARRAPGRRDAPRGRRRGGRAAGHRHVRRAHGDIAELPRAVRADRRASVGRAGRGRPGRATDPRPQRRTDEAPPRQPDDGEGGRRRGAWPHERRAHGIQAVGQPVALARLPIGAGSDVDRRRPLPARARPPGRGGGRAGRGARRVAAAPRRLPRSPRSPTCSARTSNASSGRPAPRRGPPVGEQGKEPQMCVSPRRPRLPPMAVVMLRAPLKDRADGQGQLDLPGDSLGEVLRELERRYPRLEGWVLDEHGTIRRHVNVFVDGERGRADTSVSADARVHVLPSISGGSRS